MDCPACLTYGLTREASVQVNGTLFCQPHGVEAFSGGQPGNAGPRRSSRFTPPIPTPPPVTPPES